MKCNILVTVGYLISENVWAAYCKMTGTDPWAVNEGKINSADTINLSLDEAMEVGIVHKGRPYNV